MSDASTPHDHVHAPVPSRPVPSVTRIGDRGKSPDPRSVPGTGVIPRSRAALAREFCPPSQTRIAELRALPYVDYLQTVEWRRRRDARIRQADHRCERCAAKQALQVHHVHYERLGEERDTDLEVLCRGCHEGLHRDESRRQHLGVYVKLVSEAIREGNHTFADVNAVVREKCAVLAIPCRVDRISQALETVGTNRLPERARTQQPFTPAPDGESLGHNESTEVLRRLGIVVGLRSMPQGYHGGNGPEHERRIAIQARVFRYEIDRTRSVRDRLVEIFEARV
jgi:hypothetical protein